MIRALSGFNANIHPILLMAVSSLFLVLSANVTFFSQVSLVYSWADNSAFILSLGVLVFGLTYLLTFILHLLMPTRVAVALLVLLAVFCGYFTDSFGTVIDSIMIRNTLETNISEASDLLTWSILVRVTLFALLPLVLLSRLKLISISRLALIKQHFCMLGAVFIVLTATIFSFSGHYASFFREHKPLRYFVNPIYPVYSSVKYITENMADHSQQAFVKSASFSEVPDNDMHQELVIVVVGETARADHFQLNGYARQTNPLLSQQKELISFTDITACGTSTSVSVPCMFAINKKDDFDLGAAKHTENVLDLLANAGVSVLWRDNNSDSKGVAQRIQFEDFRTQERNPNCDEECRDTGMLTGLQQYIEQQSGDILIVLHQMGSHGPAYYKRYPTEFEQFTPACQSNELAKCSSQEIINAYDNSILYTDYFLNQVITLLQNNTPQYETSMLYISDHGESLGENGLYLHGMPYLFAPEEQLKVPILAWIGESSDVDFEATNAIRHRSNSHDAVSKAILNALEIESDVKFNNVPPLLMLKPE